ncbi:lipoyl(octanoyl) transferase LipB [Pseudactinotalea sp. Z1732]|uniref:lipoyl(octanoyl) transferase LipB n=1 Tax=Micrococcales TaxID=85006 RepID=UPI003C7EB313
MLTVRTAGLAPAYLDYQRGLDLQREERERVRTGASAGTLFLLEHTSVYTAGRRTTAEELPTDGSAVVEVDRGGKVTWHGPGQLVGYPILALRRPRDVVGYLRRVESLVIDVLADHQVTGFRVPDRSGVWVDVGDAVPAKVAQVGIRVARGLTGHGFAINCSNSLEPFAAIVPCGITDAGVTTLSAVRGARIDPEDLIGAIHAHVPEFSREVAMEPMTHTLVAR